MPTTICGYLFCFELAFIQRNTPLGSHFPLRLYNEEYPLGIQIKVPPSLRSKILVETETAYLVNVIGAYTDPHRFVHRAKTYLLDCIEATDIKFFPLIPPCMFFLAYAFYGGLTKCSEVPQKEDVIEAYRVFYKAIIQPGDGNRAPPQEDLMQVSKGNREGIVQQRHQERVLKIIQEVVLENIEERHQGRAQQNVQDNAEERPQKRHKGKNRENPRKRCAKIPERALVRYERGNQVSKQARKAGGSQPSTSTEDPGRNNQ